MSKKHKKKKEADDDFDAAAETEIAGEKHPRRALAKPRKSGAKKATKRAAAKSSAISSGSVSPEPTDEEIRIRAYFIAERRHRLALPGNADSDWLEAKRQLSAESGGNSAAV